MNVVITGGSGFIGNYIQEALQQRGPRIDEVVVLDKRDGFDVTEDKIEEVTEDFDVVIHLAGVLGTEELFYNSENAVDVNIKGTLRVLESCRDYTARYLSITMPNAWLNLYQATKRAAYDLASVFHENYGLETLHVKAFNVFGKGQKVHGVQKIIPTFATAAWRREPIPIWGDGRQKVDLIHAADVARVFVDLLWATPWDNRIVEAGSEQSLTVNDVARVVLNRTHSDAGVQHLPMRRGEQGSIAVSTGQNLHLIEGRPKLRMHELLETIDWYKEDRP
jgi:UDP-glucose 4-epimerase